MKVSTVHEIKQELAAKKTGAARGAVPAPGKVQKGK